jgi:hypothetical protein
VGERRDTGPDPSRAEGEVAAEAARRLDQATAQVEALARFLEECRRHASRVALFVERRGRFEVWKSLGFPPGEGSGARPAVEANGLFDRVRLGAPVRLAAGNAVSAALGAADARDAILVPFVVREKISGAVYADVAGDDVRLDGDAVALLTWIAGLVVDRLARRKLVPSPALRPFSGAEEIAPSDAPPSFASTPAPDAPAAPLPRAEPLPIPTPALPPAEPGFAAGRLPLAGPLAPPAESERRDEARRFARLLASEIKLYNEDEVAEGRARGDLAVRLKDSIERGRRLYEERVPADVRSSRDYYFEELVEVLAGGRPEALR